MKFEVHLPENCCHNHSEFDIKVLIGGILYDKGICALGYAAESVGLEKRTLIENMGKFGIPVLKMNVNQLKKGLENARKRANSKKRAVG